MNEKANVSEELNAKHIKILEGLLKLPENRECADCKRRVPRWASVNLGIFICMQCSGIHRSLGVHISKVRSTTLDTWLPGQVAFIQSMGNEKSNSYWEAELPPNYNRVGIEKFIRAKYQEKIWVPRDAKAKSSSTNGSIYRPGPGSSCWHGYTENTEHSSEERKDAHPPRIYNKIITANGSVPVDVDLSYQSNMVPPFSIHQQQLPMLAQKSFLMAASAKSSGRSQISPAIVHQPGSKVTLIPDQNWGSIGHQVPGMKMPGAETICWRQQLN
ncbi:ADP-ribosylation factor GTPase-activating protein AGD5-like [Juglans microcarpa x Juglans regia]|uniref:ADP-ribosylation factor GTPase-activating protein AGD5-like n=1 Tax=Juglans microcarpa x Juglans regia TaxID=2249226 RepID=UPI001B7E7F06|nr:ADP-ribosylation factor GTPase-activating protein AGD5-like [Juglans microcarpa x Juglans regia]